MSFYYIYSAQAYPFKETPANIYIQAVCEVLPQIHHAVIHVIDFLCVVYGARVQPNKPVQTVLVHRVDVG